MGATRIPPHRLFDRDQYGDVLSVARDLWTNKYPHEPFDLTPDVEKALMSSSAGGATAAGAATAGDGTEKSNLMKLRYDLVDAVKRQQMFYYQVGGKLKRWQ